MRAFRRFQFVSGSAVPPAADTRYSPPVGLAANTIVPSGPQEAPRFVASHSVVGGPPPIGTFFSFPCATWIVRPHLATLHP